MNAEKLSNLSNFYTQPFMSKASVRGDISEFCNDKFQVTGTSRTKRFCHRYQRVWENIDEASLRWKYFDEPILAQYWSV